MDTRQWISSLALAMALVACAADDASDRLASELGDLTAISERRGPVVITTLEDGAGEVVFVRERDVDAMDAGGGEATALFLATAATYGEWLAQGGEPVISAREVCSDLGCAGGECCDYCASNDYGHGVSWCLSCWSSGGSWQYCD